MKKNLRIVSAAAAALLAVAPVAATVVPAASTVSAAENTTTSVVTNKNDAWLFTKNSKGEWEVAAKGSNLLNKNTQLTVSTKLAPMTLATAKKLGLDWAKDGLSLYQITEGTFKGAYVLTGDVNKLNSTTTPAKPADTLSDKINAGSSSVFYANTNTVVNISAVT